MLDYTNCHVPTSCLLVALCSSAAAVVNALPLACALQWCSARVINMRSRMHQKPLAAGDATGTAFACQQPTSGTLLLVGWFCPPAWLLPRLLLALVGGALSWYGPSLLRNLPTNTWPFSLEGLMIRGAGPPCCGP